MRSEFPLSVLYQYLCSTLHTYRKAWSDKFLRCFHIAWQHFQHWPKFVNVLLLVVLSPDKWLGPYTISSNTEKMQVYELKVQVEGFWRKSKHCWMKGNDPHYCWYVHFIQGLLANYLILTVTSTLLQLCIIRCISKETHQRRKLLMRNLQPPLLRRKIMMESGLQMNIYEDHSSVVDTSPKCTAIVRKR